MESRMKPMCIIVMIVVVAFFAITICAPIASARGYIGSRDFGSDDAELLMRLAQAELGDAAAADKATLMLDVLRRVWDPANPRSIEEVIMSGCYESVGNGEYFKAVPDAQCQQAVEMIYAGWNGKPDSVLSAVVRAVRILEYTLPILTISFAITLLTLVSIGLDKLQHWIGRRR